MADGNNAAMRGALEQASYFLHRHHTGAVYAPDGETLIFCEDVAKIVDVALAAPARNCDIGTAEEQIKRIRLLCKKYRDEIGKCKGCPVRGVFPKDCALIWAQMPYEERGDHA